MSEQIKVTDEEKQRVLELRQKFATNVAEIGQTQLSLQLYDRRLKQLFAQYEELEGQERELVKSLSDTYGDGYVDLEKGIFVKQENNN